MKSAISEALVVNIWQSGVFHALETTTGETVQVIYPGRFTHGCVGDFEDAVVRIDGQKIYGNIEVHARSSQWYSHKHNRNPKYNDTILHVAYYQDTEIPTILNNGQKVPTIILHKLLEQHHNNSIPWVNTTVRRPFNCPHIQAYHANKPLSAILSIAGAERFHVQSNSFLTSLQVEDAGQVLFAGICRSLGYSQNSQAFERLAGMLKLSLLEQCPEQTTRQALLLGTAGLLPSQRHRHLSGFAPTKEITELEQRWKSSNATGYMNETEWCFFRVRPANVPTRRIAALSQLLEKYRDSGLTHSVLYPFGKRLEEMNYRQLVNSLTVPVQGYWANHCDFHISIAQTPALIGNSKAADILVNTVLPFAHALSQVAGNHTAKHNLVQLYHSLPGTADNELIRHMKSQLHIPGNYFSACQQQGLLHIFKTCCRYRDCSHCPLTLN